MTDNAEDIRKTLMKRDAGYDMPVDWEGVGRLLKDRDRLRAELDAHYAVCLAEGKRMTDRKWQPIETAPADEMFIYYEPRDGKRCIGLAYRTVSGEWRDSEGEPHRQLNPIGWMPLPEPPR